MRLSISNIAWDREDDSALADLLIQQRIDAIDVAPAKYFANVAKATDEDIAAIRKWWGERGIEIVGMQALLFGTQGLNMFGSEQSRLEMLAHLDAVCRVGSGLGARKLVFGSPKNRDRIGLSDDQTAELACSFFQKLGDIAKGWGVEICLEPNPTCYGANFMTTSDETADVVRRVAHGSIRMQLDTGALSINGEDVHAVLQQHMPLVGHVHASEPNLVPLGSADTDHVALGAALRERLPTQVVTIEMLTQAGPGRLNAIAKSLEVAATCYRARGGMGGDAEHAK